MTETEEKRRLPVLQIVIAVLLIIAAVAVYSETQAENIEITGLSIYEKQEFLEKAGITGIFSNTYLYYLKYRYKGTENIPYIDTYSVKIKDHNSLSIRVYENDVIGSVKVMENYFLFDKDGVVLKSSSKMPDNVPLVTGLEFDEIMMFEKLDIQKQSLFNTILEIIRLLGKFEINVRQIDFDMSYEVTLSTENLTILLGRRDKFDDCIAALAGVFPDASKVGGTLDMRNYSEDNKDIILR
ncbi:MAG: cell division protein FtsQ/DivIB [Lachnospiraceae bacterium]|nr:cell division protein FtsQ/DivIB [Lachnospiraceae bacterium]